MSFLPKTLLLFTLPLVSCVCLLMELGNGLTGVKLDITVTCADCNTGLVYISIVVLGFFIPFIFGHLCGYTCALVGVKNLLAKLGNELKSANTKLRRYTSGDVEKGVLNK